MVSEIFQKPKPIIGKVSLLPLPGSPCWSGDWELLIARAEQEATTLASAGVDALLIENTNDRPYQTDTLDVAAAIAMGIITTTIQQITQLPVGIGVLLNDPETALAIALNTQASFIRLSVLSGSRLSESGLLNSRLNGLLQYQNRLHAQLPYLLADFGKQDLLLPGHSAQNRHFSRPVLTQMVSMLPQPVQQSVAFVLSDRDIAPDAFERLSQEVSIPLIIENKGSTATVLKQYYTAADSLILEANIRRERSAIPNTPPSTDMHRVESLIKTLRDIPSVADLPADVFLDPQR
jgi:membrane complex biogenesis BtpA family protein